MFGGDQNLTIWQLRHVAKKSFLLRLPSEPSSRNGGLPGIDALETMDIMAVVQEVASMKPDSHAWDEDLMFSVFGATLRRRLFVALARKSPQIAGELTPRTEYRMSNTVRHLSIMRKAGVVTVSENPVDGRRTLYSLSPAVPVTVSESSVAIRFTFSSLVAEISLPPQAVATSRWKEDIPFSVLADPARRRMLLSLARTGPQPAIELCLASGDKVELTVKRLVTMRKAGFLTTCKNPKDGRRPLYALSPNVPLTTTESGKVIDFGYCVLRLG